MATTNSTQPSFPTTRGALKIDVSTAEAIITAASEFSIFVVIRNPYDVPITIYTAQTHIPIELIDSVAEQKNKYTLHTSRSSELAQTPSMRRRIMKRLGYFFEDFLYRFRRNSGERVAEAVSTDAKALRSALYPSIPSTIEVGDITSGHGIAIGAFAEAWTINLPENATNDDLDRVFSKVEDYQNGMIPIELQPGDAHVKQFVLRARQSLFFTPIAYTFQIEIKYGVDSTKHLDVIQFRLDIRAAINAIITGSIVGGVLGALAQILSKGQIVSLGALALAVILSAVSVIAFARKTNAQQIVSIEDIWGGLFVGFMVGYLGEQFFRSIIGG